MEIRAQQLLDTYDKKVAARLATAQKDIMRAVEKDIDDRMTTADQHRTRLVEHATAAAQAGERAAVQAGQVVVRHERAESQGFSTPRAPRPQWTPLTLEVKGICEFSRRCDDEVSPTYAADDLRRIEDTLGEESETIDWEKSCAANRYMFNSKMALVLGESHVDLDSKVFEVAAGSRTV